MKIPLDTNFVFILSASRTMLYIILGFSFQNNKKLSTCCGASLGKRRHCPYTFGDFLFSYHSGKTEKSLNFSFAIDFIQYTVLPLSLDIFAFKRLL